MAIIEKAADMNAVGGSINVEVKCKRKKDTNELHSANTNFEVKRFANLVSY
jgi:hypothetical protein